MGFKEFISDLTGDSTSRVSEAGHDFRDDSGARNNEDTFESVPNWAPTETESGISTIPDGTEIESPPEK